MGYHSNTKRLMEEAERTPGVRVGCRPGSMGRRPPAGTHSHRDSHRDRRRTPSMAPNTAPRMARGQCRRPPEGLSTRGPHAIYPHGLRATRPVASPPVASASMASMPALPRIPEPRAAQEQRCHHDDHSYPLLPCSHRPHRPDITLFVSCETPRIHLILSVLYPQSPRHCHDRVQGHR